MLLLPLTVPNALDVDQYPMVLIAQHLQAVLVLHMQAMFVLLQAVLARPLQVLKYAPQQILEDCHLLVAYALHVLEHCHQQLHA